MRTLVLGADGRLGSNVVAAARDRGWTVRGTVRSDPADPPVHCDEFDVRDADRAAAVLDDAAPELVVNCTATVDVDGCERDPERARAVNGRAPGSLAGACAERGVPFVHVSTDYVFDGRASEPYDESAEPNPLQEYGESKLAGERAVRDAGGETLVARLSFVYGTHGFSGELTGFPAWVRDELAAGTAVPLFTDQRVTPTRAGQAAATLLGLAAAEARGTYHVAARSCVTPREFGALIAERLGVDPGLVDAGSMGDADREAARPRDTCLDVSRVEATLGRDQPTLAEDLAAIDGALAASVDEH
ncbi:SDR family oxidoreductase [Halosimplex rubrum]|uniref:SDR family oxidoreductase n=1 Tax=Halosimplex rubrum TaxID=869889 RepID=A0A7D5NZQ7_9EURY|nr:SDR family oxidoreductase [Halosimplex rubrum]QLH77286.1 SDR family oxidoreductase [Halosimplex rubrum]